MSSSFPLSVQVDKPEATSCHLPACLNMYHPRQALARHPEEQWDCILATGPAPGDQRWESELLFIFMAC